MATIVFMFTNISSVFFVLGGRVRFGLVLGGNIECWALPPATVHRGKNPVCHTFIVELNIVILNVHVHMYLLSDTVLHVPCKWFLSVA